MISKQKVPVALALLACIQEKQINVELIIGNRTISRLPKGKEQERKHIQLNDEMI